MATVRVDLGTASQALNIACCRRVVSEGSLLTKVAGNLVTKQIRRGGEGRGEQGTRTRAVEEGLEKLLEERGGVWIFDLEGGGRGNGVTCERVLRRDYKRASLV